MKMSYVVYLILLECLILFRASDAFFGDIMDSFSSAKNYLKASTSNITNLFIKLHRAIEVTDAAVDEYCVFQCQSRSQTPLPNPNHEPHTDGCGSQNSLLVDENWLLDERFTDCCKEHDFCYDTCNSDKDQCDLEFKKCLYGVCKKRKGRITELPCKLSAKIGYVTVMAVGCPLFKDAQKEACSCVSKGKSEL